MRTEKAYCCDDCGFLFTRTGDVWECPFCEGPHYRPATEEEAERLQSLLEKESANRAGNVIGTAKQG